MREGVREGVREGAEYSSDRATASKKEITPLKQKVCGYR